MIKGWTLYKHFSNTKGRRKRGASSVLSINIDLSIVYPSGTEYKTRAAESHIQISS